MDRTSKWRGRMDALERPPLLQGKGRNLILPRQLIQLTSAITRAGGPVKFYSFLRRVAVSPRELFFLSRCPTELNSESIDVLEASVERARRHSFVESVCEHFAFFRE
jgi:hypothetical protein